MATIYELIKEQKELIDTLFFIAESDDKDDLDYKHEIEESLSKVYGGINNKIDYLASVWLELSAITDARKEAQRKAASRARQAEKLSDGLRERIKELMVETNTKKVEGKHCNITRYLIDELVINCNIHDLPEQFIRYKEPEPIKNEIKKALKEGVSINYCSLIKKEALRIV